MRTARKWLLRVAVVGSVVGGLAIPASLVSAAPAPASPVLTAPSSGSSLASIQKQIKVQSAALEKIVEQYDGVNTTLAKNQATEAAMQKQMAPTLASLDAARQQVGSIAAVAYMDGGSMSTMSAFVSSDSTQDLADRMTLLSQVASHRQDEITRYQQLTATYQAEKQKLDALIAAENAQKKSLATQKTTINTKLASLYKLRTQAYGRAQEASSSSHPSAPYLPGRGGKVVAFAYDQLGKPYVWGADGPGSYDCSGLVEAAYHSVGVSLPHNAAMQYHAISHISRSQLSPGDLVFYSNLGHVAIYIGGGMVIHAPQPGENVKKASVNMMTPYGFGRP
ncbi:MAG TPA: NlpC/P60 family protein [Micromonosporaceae bacterium]|nr:NlpC/P60 family protein [Micromonosporaceae bacterium]